MTADELRALARRLVTIQDSHVVWESGVALSAQADLLDELEKQEPVATVCKAPFCDGKTSWAINTFNLPIGTKLYGRPQLRPDPMKLAEMDMLRNECELWHSKWKQLNDDLAEALDELDSLRNKTKPKD